jgi:imidazoleglycerol phosphate synthase glutamine amidotransferase subunit HisH
MSWNYVVVRKQSKELEEDDPRQYSYYIHEAYYNTDGSLKFMTESEVEPWGDTFEDLKENMSMMTEAFDRPVVDWDDYEEYDDE